MHDAKTPGARLRAFRTDRSLSGQALAEALGCSKSTISYWESGRTNLPMTACLALETAYGVSAQWLASGEGPVWVVPNSHGKSRKTDLDIPFLNPEWAFDQDGLPVRPHPGAPAIRFPRVLLEEIWKDGVPEKDQLFLWRVQDDAMAPLIPRGAWALIQAGAPTPSTLKEQGLYLLRLGPKEAPCLRRVARVPSQGNRELADLLIGVDAPGHLPLRFTESQVFDEHRLLAAVVWAGRSLR
jgi:transcriptional regulator with XRE-family HTH domain